MRVIAFHKYTLFIPIDESSFYISIYSKNYRIRNENIRGALELFLKLHKGQTYSGLLHVMQGSDFI